MALFILMWDGRRQMQYTYSHVWTVSCAGKIRPSYKQKDVIVEQIFLFI